jgi:hypothetical protein
MAVGNEDAGNIGAHGAASDDDAFAFLHFALSSAA